MTTGERGNLTRNPSRAHVDDESRLGHEWPHYATFVVSFLTIGIIWVNHHGQFHRIAMVDRPLLFLNLLLLMFVVLIPFPTELLASYLHSGSDQHVAAAVYSGTLLVMGLCFAASWRYVASHGQLLTRAISQPELSALIRRNAVGQGVYVVALGLAFVSAPVCCALPCVRWRRSITRSPGACPRATATSREDDKRRTAW